MGAGVPGSRARALPPVVGAQGQTPETAPTQSQKMEEQTVWGMPLKPSPLVLEIASV